MQTEFNCWNNLLNVNTWRKKKENETYKTDFMLLNRINDFLCVYLDMFV